MHGICVPASPGTSAFQALLGACDFSSPQPLSAGVSKVGKVTPAVDPAGERSTLKALERAWVMYLCG